MNLALQALLAYVVRSIARINADEWRWLLAAIASAATTFQGSDDKKGWVMSQIKARFPEMARSVASFLVEAGLQYLKAKGAST